MDNENILDNILESLSVLEEENNNLKRIIAKEDDIIGSLINACTGLKYDYEELSSQSVSEYRELCERLMGDNEQLVNGIIDAYNTEKTMMGKSVLRQLMERLGWEIKWE